MVGAVVQVSQPRQGQDVVTGDPQDGQFGQLLPIGVAWHLRTAGKGIRSSYKTSAERAPLGTPLGWQRGRGSPSTVSTACLSLTHEFTTCAKRLKFTLPHPSLSTPTLRGVPEFPFDRER